MKEDEIIAQYVKERYPEILRTYDFAIYEFHTACREFCDDFVRAIRKVDFTKLKQLVDEQNIEDR